MASQRPRKEVTPEGGAAQTAGLTGSGSLEGQAETGEGADEDEASKWMRWA